MSPRHRHDNLDCSTLGEATSPMYLSGVTASGARGGSAAFPIRSARFQTIEAPGSAAANDADLILEATLEGRTWVEVGSALTGAGISGLLDVRTYLAVRVKVKAKASSAGVLADVVIFADGAEPGTIA